MRPHAAHVCLVGWLIAHVLQVREAEALLNEELRMTQAQNAAVLDRLAKLHKVLAGSELQHNHHMRGKVRYLCGRISEGGTSISASGGATWA